MGGWMARGIGIGAAVAGGMMLAREAVARARWYDLQGRTVLIPGGSRGLGLVLARQLLGHGCRVAICGRDEETLERAARDLEERTGGDERIYAAACDITDHEQVRELVRAVREELGEIDVLINDAGVIDVGPVEEMTIEDFKREMAVHFWGPLHLMMEVLPRMRERREGRIVNISSIGGKVPVPHMAPYCASKFALAGLSGALRSEAMRDGVYVTTVYPWLMRTGSHVNARFKAQSGKEYAWFKGALAIPGGSLAAHRAAARIIHGMQRGEAEVLLGVQAVLAAKGYQLMPEWASDDLAIMNLLLPRPGRIGRRRVAGREEEPRVRWGMAGALDRAAERNNEMGGSPPT